MTLSGVPRPSQIKWCLLPVFRRSTGDGPVSAPPLSRGCGSRPRTRGTSRVRRPHSARRAGCGVQLIEDAGLLPAIQKPSAGLFPSRKPSSSGRVCQAMSLCRTYRMPCRHNRSATGCGAGAFSGRGSSSVSTSAHKSSSTFHSRILTPSRTAESSHRSRPTRALQQDPVTSCYGGQVATRRLIEGGWERQEAGATGAPCRLRWPTGELMTVSLCDVATRSSDRRLLGDRLRCAVRDRDRF